MAKCTKCGKKAGFMMSICDACQQPLADQSEEKQEEEIKATVRPFSYVMPILALIAFLSAILAFFLSWGRYIASSEIFGLSGSSLSVTFQYTGKTAGIYGWATLVLGVIGALSVSMCASQTHRAWARPLSVVVGLLDVCVLSLVMRNDPDLRLYGSVRYALSHGDWTLGYALGPGLALVGFIIAVAAATRIRTGSASGH